MTLVSSLKGTATFSYHLHIKELFLDGWDTSDFTENMMDGLQEILDTILRSGNLRHLDITYGDSRSERPTLTLEANVAMIKRIELAGSHSSDVTAWLRTMLPRMSLRELQIDASGLSWPFDSLLLQKNTLRVLDARGRSGGDLEKTSSFVRTLVAPHAETLTSITVYGITLALSSLIKLPHLHSIHLFRCHVEGWESLCESLTSLKRLRSEGVHFVGTSSENVLSAIPLCTLRSLEILEIVGINGGGERMTSRLDAVAASLSSLREFMADEVSVAALTEILTNCPNLTNIHLRGTLTDEHLMALSKLAKAPLQSLVFRGWFSIGPDANFTSKGLIEFAGSFTASMKSLEVFSCTGITPSSLRALLLVPVQELSLRCIHTKPGHIEELKRIAKTEKTRIVKTRSSKSFYFHLQS